MPIALRLVSRLEVGNGCRKKAHPGNARSFNGCEQEAVIAMARPLWLNHDHLLAHVDANHIEHKVCDARAGYQGGVITCLSIICSGRLTWQKAILHPFPG